MKVAVIGGGINGLCSTWALAQAGHQVTLFEADQLMGKTSVASSKLLHGGLRYLENFEFRLVKEALKERQWWLNKVPNLTRRLPILYPIYSHTRSRYKIKLGLMLYDFFAGKRGIGRHRWLTLKQIKRCSPQLMQKGLKGAYLFFDGQMDDRALGLWVAKQCNTLGVDIRENTPVKTVNTQGCLTTENDRFKFDHIVNVAGPWSAELLQQSKVNSARQLDLVRGSHLLLPAISKYGHMLEVPGEKRIVFVLPFKHQTLLGTTEVRQSLDEKIACSEDEQHYLLNLYNHYFEQQRNPSDITGGFAGLRPLLAGSENASTASREYQIDQQQRLTSVFGGKWTTARALGLAVAAHLAQPR